MGENKGQTIFLSVIGIATLLVAIIGATFAYFTTNMTGDKTDGSSVTTATLSTATFEVSGTAKSNVFPGDTFDDTTVVVNGGSIPEGVEVPYTCTVDLDSTAGAQAGAQPIAKTDVQWSTDGVTAQLLSAGSTFSGTLTKAAASKTWTIKATYVEKGGATDQNANQGATAKLKVTCQLTGGTIKYTAGGKQYTGE